MGIRHRLERLEREVAGKMPHLAKFITMKPVDRYRSFMDFLLEAKAGGTLLCPALEKCVQAYEKALRDRDNHMEGMAADFWRKNRQLLRDMTSDLAHDVEA